MTDAYFDSYQSGYTVTTDTFTLGPDGVIGGSGITNSGTGVVMTIQGGITSSGYGIAIDYDGTVFNSGTILGDGRAGVAENSGEVTNGASGDTTALIEAQTGILIHGGAASVTNYGTIEGTNTVEFGVGMYGGGAVTNGSASDTTALISGGRYTMQSVGGTTLTVTNYGTIEGVHCGVYVPTGAVINGGSGSTGALISGGVFGVYTGAADPVTNYGTIEATGADAYASVRMNGGGTLVNGSAGIGTALIEGGTYGVRLSADGIVDNFGTIAGDNFSVDFVTSGSVLIAEAGSEFDGLIVGAGGTLKLAGGTGTITGLGSTGTLSVADAGTFTGFGSYVIGAAGNWTMEGTNTLASGQALTVNGFITETGTLTIGSGASFTNTGHIEIDGGNLIDNGVLDGAGTIDISNGGTLDLAAYVAGATVNFNGGGVLDLSQGGAYSGVSLSNLVIGDTIDFTNLSIDGATYSGGELVLENGGTAVATIAVTGLTGSLQFTADSSSGTDMTVVCFGRGTRILTDRGEVPVETLRPGQRVVTLSGQGSVLKPVKWLGRRRMDLARHPEPDQVYPIRIEADAFEIGVPHRDVLVSPGHAIYADGVLVPAWRLVNGKTIVQDRGITTIEYFHVELDSHDILLAEGLPAESYLDGGNRVFFENAGTPVRLHATPDGECNQPGRCVALTARGPAAAALHQRLRTRAELLAGSATNVRDVDGSRPR